MKIRKGRKKYLIVLNHLINEVVLAKAGGRYDYTISRNALGLNIFECSLSEAKHNIRVSLGNGMSLVVKHY